ncbi:MFS transporter [Noviherbaspirillum sedimenti]|uniref:MFS transporter n=1 Tax=Noviherbaspirillum sedimenti TaxID=2320865 RepID=A0A3A3GMF2_9BURK|nr:MFS transporter [Noviherbaspirillum sedimenti]RJG03476.1 MFS transporter [Noviherbaspirillum sedimenti]
MSYKNKMQQTVPAMPASADATIHIINKPLESKNEFRIGYLLMLSVTIGAALGISGFPVHALPFFIGPLTETFGWTRTAVAGGSACVTAAIFFCGPIIGRLADKYGARRVIIPSICMFTFAMLLMTQIGSSVWMFYACYLLIGVSGSGTTYVCYSRVLNTWFDKHRGLALGIMTAGPGLVVSIGPMFIPDLIVEHGWRAAWAVLGGLTFIPLLLVLPFVREKQDTVKHKGGSTEKQSALKGLTFAEARRTRQFWLLIIASFTLAAATVGVYLHFISLLGDMGMTKLEGARYVSVIGIAIIISRFGSGFLLDRIFAPFVGAVICTVPALGFLAFSMHGVDVALLVAISIGMAIGAEVDFLAFASSRYFGMKSYSQIYGWMFGLMALAGAVGPIWFGKVHELTGGAPTGLAIASALCLCAGACILSLGRYPRSFE